MRTPPWIYSKREYSEGTRIRRWGSRRPLRLALTIVDDNRTAPKHRHAPVVILSLGPIGITYGPEDNVSEGYVGQPESAWWRWLLHFKSGTAIGINYDGTGW